MNLEAENQGVATREPVVIEERGDQIGGLALISLGVLLLGFLLWGLFLLQTTEDWKENSGFDICYSFYAMIMIFCFGVISVIFGLGNFMKRKFVISERGIEYWKPGLILYQARWEDISAIESLPGWSKPILEVTAREGAYSWMGFGTRGVSEKTLRQVFDLLADRAIDHPHIRVVKKGDRARDTEVLQKGRSSSDNLGIAPRKEGKR